MPFRVRERSKASRVVLAVVAGLALGAVPVPSQALPHGCVSVSSDYHLSVDLARRSANLAVYRNEPCTFYYSPGDTFTGSGEYKITCSTGGVFTDSREQGPQVLIPIPQPCAPGALVTIHSYHPWRGGAVVAGSLT